jgi:hypothetical protein
MAKETTYRVVSQSKFTGFLKKFASVDTTLLVEIADGEIKAKSHTPDRAVVKFSKMGLNEAFDLVDGVDEPLVFGLFNIEKFASSFKHFGNDNFDLVITHDTSDGKNIGTVLTLRSPKLTIRFDCASYRLFTHITDELFLTGIAGVNGDLQSQFDLDKTTFSSISSICGIDSDHKLITFKAKGRAIKASGKSFDMEVVESDKDLKSAEISFYKTHFNFVDREDSDVKIAAEKIVFSSSESDTICVIGKTDED